MVALAAMLFTQAALALAACKLDGGAPARIQASGMSEASAQPCHQPAESVNLCLAHCRGDKQTLDKPQVKVPAPSIQQAALAVNLWPQLLLIGVSGRPAPAPTVAPPPRILFQSFLI
jgi:hypothetical protein